MMTEKDNPFFEQVDLFAVKAAKVDEMDSATDRKKGSKKSGSLSRRQKTAWQDTPKTSQSQELTTQLPAVVEGIRIAKAYSADPTMPYFSARVSGSVLANDNLQDVLKYHAQVSMTRENLRDLHMIEEDDETQEQEQSQGNTVTMSEFVLSPILKDTGLTTYDRGVLEAIYSHLLASPSESNAIITIRGIFRTMCGTQDSKISVSKTQQERIMNSVLRLMGTVVAIEVSGSLRGGERASMTKWINLLPAEIEQINIGGSVTTSVRVTSYPNFLSYASYHNGLTKTPLDMLNIPGINSTDRNRAIVNYLQHRLAAVTYSYDAEQNKANLKDPKKLPINYDAIFDAADITPKKKDSLIPEYSDTYKSRVRKITRQVLDRWQEKGYIKGYEEVRTRSDGGPLSEIVLELADTLPPVE